MTYVCKEAGWYRVGDGEPRKVAFADGEVLDYIKANDRTGYEELMMEVAEEVCDTRAVIREMLKGRCYATFETLTPHALDHISEQTFIDAGELEFVYCEVGDEIEGD